MNHKLALIPFAPGPYSEERIEPIIKLFIPSVKVSITPKIIDKVVHLSRAQGDTSGSQVIVDFYKLLRSVITDTDCLNKTLYLSLTIYKSSTKRKQRKLRMHKISHLLIHGN